MPAKNPKPEQIKKQIEKIEKDFDKKLNEIIFERDKKINEILDNMRLRKTRKSI